MNDQVRHIQRYYAPRFWLSLLSATMLLPSAYWAASIALSGLRHWFAVFSGCMFFVIVGFAIALFRRAVEERRKKRAFGSYEFDDTKNEKE
jgi:protein-S-isoprenylcysteine O-methyltransferase Ste14